MATIKEKLEVNTSDVITATQKLLEGLSDRKGQFVWKQLTAEGGDFVAFVTADDESAYPDGGTQDGYWYELVEEGVSGIDMGEITPSKDTTSISFPTSLTAVPSALLMYTATRSAGEYEIGMLFLTNHDMTASYGWYGIRLANSGGSLNKTIRNYVSYSNGSLKVDIGSMFSGSITYKWLAIV